MAEYQIKNNGWLVVADGEKALFLRNVGDEKFPRLEVFRELEQADPPTREQGESRPGRLADSGGSHRSAVQETDWHRVAKIEFAQSIAEKLHKHAQKREFDEIIIAAPPVVLGELRKALNKDVQDRVVAEIAKDLTKHPVHEILKQLFGAE